MSAHQLLTAFWHVTPDPSDETLPHTLRCHGYDVVGELATGASYGEYIYLMFKGEAPSAHQLRAFEALAIVVANPGPQDPSVHAALCGSVGGSPAAACLMAGLSVAAGHSGGARELFHAMENWQRFGVDSDAWRDAYGAPPEAHDDTWPGSEIFPGYQSAAALTLPIQQLVELGARLNVGRLSSWLATPAAQGVRHPAANRSLSLTGWAAALLVDLGFSPEEGEMLWLLLRLPGAAKHTLEYRGYGFRQFPTFALEQGALNE